MFWYWFFAGPALLLALLSLRGERQRAAYVAGRLAETPASLPPATVIVPVKGDDEGLRQNLAALAAQDYPDYELIVAANQAADIPPGVLPSRVKIVLAHREDPSTSDKIQNLLAAIHAVRKTSAVLAFADSDSRPGPRWLQALVGPLYEEGVGASTGYRWFTPQPPTFWTLLRGVWDAVAMGRLGAGDNGFVWGGAMAVRKETFFEARVTEYWRSTVSDDYALAEAIHAAGLRIAWAPGATTPSCDRVSARGFFAWARRQMLITRIYRPELWGLATAAHIFYCGGMAASIWASARGHRLAEWALIAQLSPGMLKGLNRATVAKAAMPECDEWFRRHAWVHAIWQPLVTWVWLIVLLSSAFGRSIVWRGRRYALTARR